MKMKPFCFHRTEGANNHIKHVARYPISVTYYRHTAMFTSGVHIVFHWQTRGGGPLVVENREGVFSRYPKKESGSWGESDRGGIRLWGKVYNVSAKWKVFLDLIG